MSLRWTLLTATTLGCSAPVPFDQPGSLPEPGPTEGSVEPPGLTVELDTWAVDCAPPGEATGRLPEADWTALDGLFVKVVDGVTEELPGYPVVVSVGPDGAFHRDVAALGLIRDSWRTHGGWEQEGDEGTMASLWRAGGEGSFWAATQVQDAPANEVTVTDGEVCVSERSFEWRATVTYPWTDPVHDPSGYLDGDVPEAVVTLHQALVLDGDELRLGSLAQGSLSDGTPLEMRAAGTYHTW